MTKNIMKRTLLTLLLAVAFPALLSGCATYSKIRNFEKPDVNVVGFQLAESSFFEQRFLIDLRVRNPNDFELPIIGLNYDLILNAEKLASGGANEDMTVPALGERVVQVSLSTSALDWLKQLQHARKTKAGEGLPYVLKGKVFLRDLAIKSLPFTRDGLLRID